MSPKAKNLLFALFAALFAALVLVPECVASPAAGYTVFGRQVPTVVAPGGEVEILLTVMDVGANTNVTSEEGRHPGTGEGDNPEPKATLTATLPEGLTPTGRTSISKLGYRGLFCGSIVGKTVTCELTELGKMTQFYFSHVVIDARVSSGVSGKLFGHVMVTGGGAPAPASASVPITVGTNEPAAGIEQMGAFISNEEGGPDTQAGSHPYEIVTEFGVNTVEAPGAKRILKVSLIPNRQPGGVSGTSTSIFRRASSVTVRPFLNVHARIS
jgi:hypothetical protein